MKYQKGRKKKQPATKITRNDIEKAMREYKGEIKYLKIGKDNAEQIQKHPFSALIV